MVKIALALLASLVISGPALAQTCLHPSTSETPEQIARRRAALAAARTINNIQYNRPGAREKVFLRHDELASAPFVTKSPTPTAIVLAPDQDIVPGWRLSLDTYPGGYWFSITDVTDPCKFTYISNHSGLIYTAEPLR
ncbi:MAG: hypothetical protein K2Y23_23905 [Cyanobacteria bacterium]|nr:hypothetical protein [Cyanobacteriota bacterium]